MDKGNKTEGPEIRDVGTLKELIEEEEARERYLTAPFSYRLRAILKAGTTKACHTQFPLLNPPSPRAFNLSGLSLKS